MLRPRARSPDDFPKEQKDAAAKMLRERFVNDADALPKFMEFFSQKLRVQKLLCGPSKAFLCGPTPTIADVRLLPQLRYYQRGAADYVPKTCLDAYPEITGWIERMLAWPPIKEWYAVEGH